MEETPSVEETAEAGTPEARNRIRGAFGFLRAPAFWGGLAVGLVALGVGVGLGLGIDRWMDDDRKRDADERGQFAVHAFRMDPSGEWDREDPPWPGGKRFRFRFPAGKPGDWTEGWEDRKRSEKWRFEQDDFSPNDGLRERGSYLSDAELALVERFIDAIEELIDEVGDYLEKGGFDRSGDRQFGPAWFFEGDFWKDFEGALFGDEYRRGDGGFWSFPEGSGDDDQDSWDDGREDEGFWGEEDGPLGGFGFPFGEFLPGFAFLEDCELDSLELPDLFENFPDEEDGPEDAESLEDFFEQIDELFREACEQPSDG